MKITRYNDLVRLMLDPATAVAVSAGVDPIRSSPDYLGSFVLGGTTWHAMRAHDYHGEIYGWELNYGSDYRGASESYEDFIEDPQQFADKRYSWQDRGRPGWSALHDVGSLGSDVIVRFIRDDGSMWQGGR